VAKKAVSDGIPVKLEVWPGMVHVFQIRGLPESREAIEHIAEFMIAHAYPARAHTPSIHRIAAVPQRFCRRTTWKVRRAPRCR